MILSNLDLIDDKTTRLNNIKGLKIIIKDCKDANKIKRLERYYDH